MPGDEHFWGEEHFLGGFAPAPAGTVWGAAASGTALGARGMLPPEEGCEGCGAACTCWL